VLGTEEQSCRAGALSELVPLPYVELPTADVQAMGAKVGDLVEVALDGTVLVLPLCESPGLPRGVARFPRDLRTLETAWGTPLPAWAAIRPFREPR
jgi:anaerobic selenocysteine-containing dehydrogenase